MTRGIKVRLLAFVVLSAVGVVYVAASYLGIVDKVLGRGIHVAATLPTSGGLYVGSDVTYRGVKVGQVSGMDVIPSGVRVDLSLQQGTRLPLDSPMHVHNLSAVGEQYLDFEPASSAGPYARNGDVMHGNASSLPVDEGDLLVSINDFVDSVNKKDLRDVVGELGTMFDNTAKPLQHMVDAGDRFVAAARAHEAETLSLFDTSRTVLRTQAAHAQDIRSFARDLADLTGTLRGSDTDLRTILQGGPATMREVDSLLRGLEPTLPIFIGNLTTVNQVFVLHLDALEQTLVTFPRVISSGFVGTPGDGYGHINLQFNNSVPACTKGYLPPKYWRPATDLSDKPYYHARCASGAPLNMRGSKYAPGLYRGESSGAGYRVAPYDATTGRAAGTKVVVGRQGGRTSVFGTDAWQWMLLGPLGPAR
ncbi:MAG TPA: MlaD family protein [Marmoricola sp.]|nr:MlaD family protein [Marmoricola sp.]